MEPYLLARIIVQARRAVVAIMAAAIVVSVALCLFLPRRYAASFVLISPDGVGNTLLQSLGRGAYNMGVRGWVIPRMLESEPLLEDVMGREFSFRDGDDERQMSVARSMGISGRREVIRASRRAISTSVDKVNGAIVVSVETRYPELSYQAAAYLLERLHARTDRMRQQLRRTFDTYYAGRLSEAYAELETVEASMVAFLSSNRSWVDATDPELNLELERIKRRQSIHAGVYAELRKQAEIDDIKTLTLVPPIEVLDTPSLPTLKSFPRRKVILVAGGMLGILLGIAWAMGRELYRRSRSPLPA